MLTWRLLNAQRLLTWRQMSAKIMLMWSQMNAKRMLTWRLLDAKNYEDLSFFCLFRGQRVKIRIFYLYRGGQGAKIFDISKVFIMWQGPFNKQEKFKSSQFWASNRRHISILLASIWRHISILLALIWRHVSNLWAFKRRHVSILLFNVQFCLE